jgi:hypothetical protein
LAGSIPLWLIKFRVRPETGGRARFFRESDGFPNWQKALCWGAMRMILLAVVVLAGMALTGMAAEGSPKKGKLKHVVSFKFKESASKEDIAKLEREFKGLEKKIKEIKGFEAGTNNSPEGLNKGFTHAWILTFDSEADRNTYLKHPDHEQFGKLAGSLIADVFVIDFWSGN